MRERHLLILVLGLLLAFGRAPLSSAQAQQQAASGWSGRVEAGLANAPGELPCYSEGSSVLAAPAQARPACEPRTEPEGVRAGVEAARRELRTVAWSRERGALAPPTPRWARSNGSANARGARA